MTSPSSRTERPGRSLNMLLGLALGAVFTLVGLAGFFVTDLDHVATAEGQSLLGFDVTMMHNLVHLLIGVTLLVASREHSSARATNVVIGAVYLLLGALGHWVNGSALDVLGLNGADHVLHVLSGLLLLAVGLGADRHRAPQEDLTAA